MNVHVGHSQLLDLVKGINPILESLNQEPFYSNPQFHSSFAWTTQSHIHLESITSNELSTLSEFHFHIHGIHVNIGNQSFYLHLKS